MKQVSIQDLKASLSTVVAEAESGQTILITRHSEPVARLGPAHPAYLHAARSARGGRLRPAIKRGTSGRYLAVLLEDRGDR